MTAPILDRWTDATWLVHIVWADPFRSLTFCGRFDYPETEVWQLKPGDAHEVCVTCKAKAAKQ